MDRIALMRSFVAAASAESFNAGAQKLGLSGSLVSRHVSELERELDVRLVNRNARSLSLTDDGRRYREFCDRVLKEIAQEDAAIRQEPRKAEGTLAVLAPKWIGSRDLGDAIVAFARDRPQITVHFDVGGGADGSFDFISRGYDIEFHTKQLRDSSVKVRRIATLPFVLCASPGYLAASAALTQISDLAEHRCLVHENDHIWHFMHDGGARRQKIAAACFSSNAYLMLHDAAIEGVGIAMLPLSLVFDDIREGRMQLVLPDWLPPARPLYLAYPPGLQSVRKLEVFRDYLVAWFDRQAARDLERLGQLAA